MGSEKILEIEHVSKEFPGVKALDDITLSIKKGEIHAIVGENGAGKSTLMKVLSGVYPYGTYEGKIKINGQVKTFKNVRDAEESGIAIIYQELVLIKDLSIIENIYLGNEIANKGIIDWEESEYNAKKWIEYVGLKEDPRRLVREIGVGKQQLVEIAKALSKNATILILDEPTAALTENEVENLMSILKELKKKGVTCIYISHKLEEVLRISDTVTIMRDGKVVDTESTHQLNERAIISMMVGREITNRFPKRNRYKGELAFEVKNWTMVDSNMPGKYIFKDINFKVYEGEVVGIAGLMGAGRTELVNSICGSYPRKYVSGEIYLKGRKISINRISDVIKHGIGLLTEDRKRYGLNMVSSVSKNVTLSNLKMISKYGVINENEEIKYSNKFVKELKIKTRTIEDTVSTLSGGNQQKVVLAKLLMSDPKLIFLDEPTRGIDVGAKYEIYNLINELSQRGIGIVMVSSELPEIIGMCDKILVMHEGRITGIYDHEEATEEKIMTDATGGVKVG